ncbi:MAG: hypothetical protein LDL13_06625 [Calditerrivibrio sp.]|nr:hypothetical protein [Calditerrivibrio sp.]MCA1980736.1 hypothetical protein [Calditerrivibrio sp.]
MKVAGIDIGTNTVRVIVADVQNGKIRDILYQNRAVTRLGEDLVSTNRLKEDAINRTAKVAIQFYNEALSCNVERVKCCATSASREAENGEVFLDILKKAGLPVEVIDGKLEGELTCMGVMAGIDLFEQPSLIIDIGGGSTELIVWDGKNIHSTISYKIGVVKLADLFNYKDICSSDIFDKTKEYITSVIGDYDFGINIQNVIATAGTPTTLAAIDLKMVDYDYRKVNGYRIKKGRIEEILTYLSSLEFEKRKEVAGLEAGREDLIIPGSLLLIFFLDKTGKEELIVSDYGLREGIAIAASL